VRAGTLIDGVSTQAHHNLDILIRGNHIVEVNATGAHAPPDCARLIDLSNSTVLGPRKAGRSALEGHSGHHLALWPLGHRQRHLPFLIKKN
jgi:hypothetical protein